MNKIVKAVGLIALAAMVVVTIGSCDLIALSVSGSVVNVQAAKDSTSWWKSTDGTYSLDGATITLTNLKTSTTYPGTVSNGTYTIVGVPAGTYKVTGSAPGWTFVPRQVDLTGYLNTLPNILAYVTPSGSNADQILVMVEWTNLDMDVDSYMVRDTNDNNTNDGGIVAGFVNGTSSTYYTDSNGKVSLDRDVTQNSAATIPRVETIRVSSPVSSGSFEQLRYYLRLYNQTTGSLTGNSSVSSASASATVFVMQGTEDLGTYQIAVDSNECVLGVVQMEWTIPSSGQWTIGSYANPYFTNGDSTGTTGIKSISQKPVVVDAIK